MVTHVSSRLEQELAEIEFKNQNRPKTANPDAIKKEIDRLNILFQKGRITESYYDEQYEILDKQLRESAREQISIEDYSNLINAFSGNWQELYYNLDKAHKQIFWKSTIKDIQVDPDTHKISGFNFITNLE